MDILNLFTNHLNWFQNQGPRPAGSSRNREADRYIKDVFLKNGYDVETQEFPCCYWSHQRIELSVNNTYLSPVPNSYTPSCSLNMPFEAFGSVEELELADLSNKIAVIYGQLTMEVLTPKGNKFFNPEEHKRIVSLLERKNPAAVIAISHEFENPRPVIEDCDFNIPSVTVSAIDGLKLLMHRESTIKLSIPSQRSTGNASNIIGRRTKGSNKKIVICANFDTRYNSTGAFDNASGTCALLTIAEVLAGKDLNIGLEFIAFNDEEYTAKGAVVYLEKYRNTFPEILTAINLDAIGNRVGVNCMTSFETDSNINALIDNLLKKYSDIRRADQWYSEDHTIFLLCNVPTLAFSSMDFPPIVQTQWDNIEWVDPNKAQSVISFVVDYVGHMADTNAKKPELINTKGALMYIVFCQYYSFISWEPGVLTPAHERIYIIMPKIQANNQIYD